MKSVPVLIDLVLLPYPDLTFLSSAPVNKSPQPSAPSPSEEMSPSQSHEQLLEQTPKEECPVPMTTLPAPEAVPQTKPIPPPTSQLRKRNSPAASQTVVYPSKESCLKCVYCYHTTFHVPLFKFYAAFPSSSQASRQQARSLVWRLRFASPLIWLMPVRLLASTIV